MDKQKLKLPKTEIEIENNITSHTERFPFYIKNFGYLTDKKFSVGDDASHNDILILYSLSSVVEFSHDRHLVYLSPHDLVISSCHSPLRFNVVGSEKWKFFYLVIGGSHAKLYYNLIRTKYHYIRINPLSRVIDIFNSITETQFNGSTLSDMRLSLLVNDLLYELYEVSCNIVECKNLIPVQDTEVNNAISYINNHYKDPISIDTICNEVCLSKHYFCKIFKKHTGTSIHQYINEFRVNKSKDLLSYSKLSINSIASAVGFKNTLSYIRWFEKIAKMTPSEYRNNF